ncbi:MFS-type transporter SLC18B1-like [Pocillopora verrucosa]|uniref:MFS-type transporter SLC18B1-like n=1 Tax=Pocillopora verrucosa TaxID=203993 RepID=UPI00333E7244
MRESSSEILLPKSTGETRPETVEETWNARNIVLLLSMCLVYFVLYAAYSVYAPFLPSEAEDRGVSKIYVGLIFGSYAFAIFLTSPPWGVLVPKYGARNILLTGIFIAGTSLMLMGFGEVIFDPTMFIVFCFVLRITSAIGAAAAETSVLAFVLQRFPNNTGAIAAGMQLSCLGGNSFAPVFGGFLYTVGGFKLPFIIMGIILLCSTGILAFLLSHETESQKDDESKESISICKSMRPLKIPAVFMMEFTSVIGCLCYGFIQPILAPQLRKLGQNSVQIGLVFFFFAGFNALSAIALGFIADKTKCYRLLLLFGVVTFSIGYLLLGPAPFLPFLPADELWLIRFAIAFTGFFTAFFYVPLLPEILKVASENGMPENEETKAVLSSLYNTMSYLGLFIGPSLGGALAEHFGFAWAVTVAALIGLALALTLLIFTLVENASQRKNSNRKEEKLSLLN